MSRQQLNLSGEESSQETKIKQQNEEKSEFQLEIEQDQLASEVQEDFSRIKEDIFSVIKSHHSLEIKEKRLEILYQLINYNLSLPEKKELKSKKIGKPEDKHENFSGVSTPKKNKKSNLENCNRNLDRLYRYIITDTRNPSPFIKAELFTITSAKIFFNQIIKRNLNSSEFHSAKQQYGIDSPFFLQAWEEEHRMRFLVTHENNLHQPIPTRQLRMFREGSPSQSIPNHGQGTGKLIPEPSTKVTTAGTFYLNPNGLIYKIDNISGGFKPIFESLVWPLLILYMFGKDLLAETIEVNGISIDENFKKNQSIFLEKNDLALLADRLLTNEEKEKLQVDNVLSPENAIIRLEGGLKKRISSRQGVRPLQIQSLSEKDESNSNFQPGVKIDPKDDSSPESFSPVPRFAMKSKRNIFSLLDKKESKKKNSVSSQYSEGSESELSDQQNFSSSEDLSKFLLPIPNSKSIKPGALHRELSDSSKSSVDNISNDDFSWLSEDASNEDSDSRISSNLADRFAKITADQDDLSDEDNSYFTDSKITPELEHVSNLTPLKPLIKLSTTSVRESVSTTSSIMDKEQEQENIDNNSQSCPKTPIKVFSKTHSSGLSIFNSPTYLKKADLPIKAGKKRAFDSTSARFSFDSPTRSEKIGQRKLSIGPSIEDFGIENTIYSHPK